MTSAVDRSSRPRRRHDAEASRRALLAAASALFDERGYDAATVREIGERAGVDPALIARYFGGKEGLFVETLERDACRSIPTDPAEALGAILAGSERHGIGPIGLSVVNPALGEELRGQTARVVRTRVVEPLARELAARGVADPELRAEALFALALGIALTRAGGTLPRLAGASVERLRELLDPAAEALLEGSATGAPATAAEDGTRRARGHGGRRAASG